MKPARARFFEKVNIGKSGCHYFTGKLDVDGYGRFDVSTTRTQVGAHRYAWELANGDIPPGLCVLHACDVPNCVNQEHLFLGTHQVNQADKIAKGRQAYGEQTGQAKLTVKAVRSIRRIWPRRSLNFLARKHGVSKRAVLFVVQRKTWKRA